MKKIIALIISFILIILGVKITNIYLEDQINKSCLDIVKLYGDQTKNTTYNIQSTLAKNKNVLMTYGSSELGTTDIFSNPINFFPKKNNDFIVCPIGRGYIQDLQHAMKVGYNTNIQNKKAVFIISLQWFLSDDGISNDEFQMNFSENELYSFVNDPQVSKNTKRKICKRVYELSNGNDSLLSCRVYARLYSSDNILYKSAFLFLQPYYMVKHEFLNLKDNIYSYKLVNANKGILSRITFKSNEVFNKDYELKKAEDIAKNLVTNNDFNINDVYYNAHIKDNLKVAKNVSSNVTLVNSKEFNDIKLLLEVCKEKQVKPLFILMPVNGKWYDYAGLNKSVRDKYINKLEGIISSEGFKYVDFQDHEYEKYFMEDGMHLGWKGWVYIDDEIQKYYK